MLSKIAQPFFRKSLGIYLWGVSAFIHSYISRAFLEHFHSFLFIKLAKSLKKKSCNLEKVFRYVLKWFCYVCIQWFYENWVLWVMFNVFAPFKCFLSPPSLLWKLGKFFQNPSFFPSISSTTPSYFQQKYAYSGVFPYFSLGIILAE